MAENTGDYYQVLGVPYTASQEEIRKVFRQLAVQYHPDKNPGNLAAEEHFKQVQEAYFVLGDTDRREQYHLRSRYPLHNRRSQAKTLTPALLLARSKRLKDHVARIDVFRMSQELLYAQVNNLLSEKNMALLIQQGDPSLNSQFVANILHSCRPLDFHFTHLLNPKLAQLAGTDNQLLSQIFEQNRQRKWQYYWDRLNVPVIILLTLLICLLLWRTARN